MTKPTIEAFVDEALACKERGYQGYKIHAVGDPDIDIKLCTAARKALGDSYALMIDVVSGYDQYQALRVGRALEDLGFPLVRGATPRIRHTRVQDARRPARHSDRGG